MIQNAMQQAWAQFQAALRARWTVPAGLVPGVTIVPTWRQTSGRLEVSILMKVADSPSLIGCAPCAAGNQRCPCAWDGRAIAGRYRFEAGALAQETLFSPHAVVVTVIATESSGSSSSKTSTSARASNRRKPQAPTARGARPPGP